MNKTTDQLLNLYQDKNHHQNINHNHHSKIVNKRERTQLFKHQNQNYKTRTNQSKSNDNFSNQKYILIQLGTCKYININI